jgi:hypothetical protein
MSRTYRKVFNNDYELNGFYMRTFKSSLNVIRSESRATSELILAGYKPNTKMLARSKARNKHIPTHWDDVVVACARQRKYRRCKSNG